MRTGNKHNTIVENNLHFEEICARSGISLRIRNVDDQDLPRCVVTEESHGLLLVLNLARIPEAEYPAYAGYHVRQVLLPRLVLETPRLRLRRYRETDAQLCYAFLSNEADAYMDCCRVFSNMDEEYYEHVALFGQRESQYMVVLKKTDTLIGTVNVFADDSRAVDTMEIGYSIAHAHQRQGYGMEAVGAIVDLLQNDLYLELVTAGVLPENAASEKLLKKLGFCREGVRHKAVWHEGLGRPVDLVYYYKDREEGC